MRFNIELSRHLSTLLTELAEEQFRSPRQQAEFILTTGIERAVVEREQAREHTLDAFLAQGDSPHCQPEVDHATA